MTRVATACATSPADLTLVHYERHVVGSGIADWVAKMRGYRTVTGADAQLLEQLGFSEEQRAHVPALLIPLHDVHGDRAGYEFRPDTPRVTGDGREAKYERPAGRGTVLDVHPSARLSVEDVEVPLLITEGTKKADAALSAINSNGRGLILPVALQGVACWCTSGHAHADWWRFALSDRKVYVCFDSDVMTKASVHGELVKLVGFLRSRGAVVRPIYLPPGTDGTKVGLDDFLAAGHTLTDALNLSEENLRAPADRRAWLTFGELLTLPTLPWLVEGLLPAEGVTVIFGTWGAYKSFVVLDWLAAVSSGATDWFGLPIRKHGPTICVYAEGRAGLAQRAQALKLARHLGDDIQLIVWPNSIDLADPAAVERLVSDIDRALDGVPPAVFAIDTLARNMPGRDENKQQDMSAFIAGCDRLRTAFKCQVVVVHHTNREGGVRGSTVLPGAADTLIEVERQAERETRLSVRKQKDGQEAAWMVRLRLEAASLIIAGIKPEAGTAAVSSSESGTGFKWSPPRLQVLRALFDASYRNETLRTREWMKRAGATSSPLYDVRDELRNRGWLRQTEDEKGDPLFALSAEGVKAVDHEHPEWRQVAEDEAGASPV